jgi:hypothetical protein
MPVPPFLFLRAELVALVIVLIATGTMARVDGCSMSFYGLGGQGIVRKLVAGWIGGLATLSGVVVCLAATGQIRFHEQIPHDPRSLGFGCLWLILFLVQSMTEETLFRGYVQTTLARGIGFWPAAFAVSLLFALGHLTNSSQTAILALTAGVAGFAFCLLLRVSGSLWLGISFRAAWNWAQSFLYGTADSALVIRDHLMTADLSGGLASAGPEGSLLAPPALILGALGLVVARQARKEAKKSAGEAAWE